MKPSRFTYHAPTTVEDAINILCQYDGDARILAGGQSLIPTMNFRMAAPAALVDLGKIPALAYIQELEQVLRIGAMTRQRSVEFSPLIREKLPLLHEAIKWVGHLPTRSRGTIGGSIAYADPSTEIPMVMQTLGGEVTARGPNGQRIIKASDFFISALTTALEPTEILVEVRFPVMNADTGFAVEEFARRHGDFAIVAIAAAIQVKGEDCVLARLGAAGVGDTQLKLSEAEAVLLRLGLSDEAIAKASAAAAAELKDPPADRNGSADYRRHLTKELASRAIRRAVNVARRRIDAHPR